MRPSLLLGSTEVPSVGGSSTASYELFRRMRQDGYDVHYANLVAHDRVALYEAQSTGELGNPGALSNVQTCRLYGRFHDPHPELEELIASANPDVVVGFGFPAVELLTASAPARRTVLVTGTCRQAQDYVTSGRAPDAVSLGRALANGSLRPRIINHAERRAVEACDLMVTHSAMTRDFMAKFFPASVGKTYRSVISFAEWITGGVAPWRAHARDFEDRDVDLLFIASDWARPEKNYPLLAAIARRMRGSQVHVVGHVPHRLPSVTHHGFIGLRDTLFELMGRSRCVACPSRMDAAPGILFEASAMGCNVVASKNCGNWELCSPDLLADPFDDVAFVACIRRALTQPQPDHIESFLQRHSYDEWLALLAAFAQPFEPGDGCAT